jgi:hypothetical protein
LIISVRQKLTSPLAASTWNTVLSEPSIFGSIRRQNI